MKDNNRIATKRNRNTVSAATLNAIRDFENWLESSGILDENTIRKHVKFLLPSWNIVSHSRIGAYNRKGYARCSFQAYKGRARVTVHFWIYEPVMDSRNYDADADAYYLDDESEEIMDNSDTVYAFDSKEDAIEYLKELVPVPVTVPAK